MDPETEHEVARHREELLACARRVLGDRDEAEDVVQELFVKVRTAPPRPAPAARVPWLFAVCYRLAVDHLRARARRDRTHARAASSGGGAEQPADRDRIDRVRARLEALEEPYRTVVRLRYLDELPFDVIAARMGTIERTARTWVARGLERLRGGGA